MTKAMGMSEPETDNTFKGSLRWTRWGMTPRPPGKNHEAQTRSWPDKTNSLKP